MITLAKYPIEDILPLIGFGNPYRKITIGEGTYTVKMSGTRLECFKRNLQCVGCNRVGNLWLLQRHVNRNPRFKLNCFIENCAWCIPKMQKHIVRAHFNLYHKSKKGQLTLMTQDHIFPKSLGGSNGIDNMQTMCLSCNQKKGANIPNGYSRDSKDSEVVDGGSFIDERLSSLSEHASQPTVDFAGVV
jgi:5-methylcytosine-specific restriction endonuclease McrA